MGIPHRQDPEHARRQARIRGTRLSVELIAGLFGGSRSIDEIVETYPHITAEDVEACVRYKATGRKLTGRVTEAQLNAWMNEADAERDRKEMARLRKLAADAGDRPQYWKTRIVSVPGILSGKPIIKGTRLSVEFITDEIARGSTEAEMLYDYPRLTPEDIEACIQYKASGKKLSPTTWTDYDRRIEEEDAERERKEVIRLRKLVAGWDGVDGLARQGS